MPVAVRYVCPKCKGETEIEGETCIACSFKAYMKNMKGDKHPFIKL